MRLLTRNAAGEIDLTENLSDEELPRYAILSHTWGCDEDEVTFQDLQDGTGKTKRGYEKIKFCGDQAWDDGLQFFWVDTCCIDKTDLVELTDAINSMFRWYQNATKCYVYLADVPTPTPDAEDKGSWALAFQKSRWHTRGWTLQELLAPMSIEFFSAEGVRLGDRQSLENDIHHITRLPLEVLRGSPLPGFSISERLSWAEKRQTKRGEDRAYSLLGIVGIYMPLIYGEGEESAFRRLRIEAERTQIVQAPPLRRLFEDEDSESARPSKRRNQGVLSAEGSSSSTLTGGDSDRIDDSVKEALVEKLFFPNIDTRLTSLRAYWGTCRWFLSKPEYVAWRDIARQSENGDFLWIKGHPGTGKSTLMRFLFEEVGRSMRSDPSHITLSFFFLARGTALEKSTTGLYRSLLYQLFKKAVDLKDSLDWMASIGTRGIQHTGWSEQALKQTLKEAVSKLGSRSLMIFVDAIDECHEQQMAQMVRFFEELRDHAKDTDGKLRICFSSRHYPHIVIANGVQIVLEGQVGHVDDIHQYLKSTLWLGKTKQAESLRSEILEKSSGIFLWVVLVVDLLNAEYRSGSISIKAIRSSLKAIPPGLVDLFQMILGRDQKSIQELHICLRWILFARRPLKPQEFFVAVQLALDRQSSTCWDQEGITLDDMRLFVRTSTKGLAEVSRSKGPEVQFIHESVRDFLLGRYGGQWSGPSGNFEGHSQNMLRDCCLAQLDAPVHLSVDIPEPPQVAGKGIHNYPPELRETLSLKFPFLEYSVRYVLQHANTAQDHGVQQGDFFDSFPLLRWVAFNNALERFPVRRYTKGVSILHLLAKHDCGNLIRVHPQATSSSDTEGEQLGPPPSLAALTDSITASLPSRTDGDTAKFGSVTGSAFSKEPGTEIFTHVGDDNETVVSDVSYAEADQRQSYVSALATDLVNRISRPRSRDRGADISKEMLAGITKERLSERLKSFALMIGQESPNPTVREVMVFVYKHRVDIAQLFLQNFNGRNEESEDIDQSNSEERPKPSPGEQMALNEKIRMWKERGNIDFTDEPNTYQELPPNEAEDKVDEPILPAIEKYEEVIFKSASYEWLLSSIRADCMLAFVEQDHDLMGAIRRTVLRELPMPRHISRHASAPIFTVVFEPYWDLGTFLRDNTLEGREGCIWDLLTLTGSVTDAQCLTVREYLAQTWPATADYFIGVVENALWPPKDRALAAFLPSDSMANLLPLKLVISGSSERVVEVGQQLTWLVAALSPSPRDHVDGLLVCKPDLDKAQYAPLTPKSPQGVVFTITVSMERYTYAVQECGSNSQCWHDLFRSPVLVQGFPIKARITRDTGLEISLETMASLIKAGYINTFHEKIFMKGFSSMIVPIKRVDDLLVWHLLFTEPGGRISYLDTTRDHDSGISLRDVQQYRHVVGWCSEADYLAGSRRATYNVDRSRLPEPHPGCMLEKCSITAGMYVTAGASIGLCTRDKPVRVRHNGYLNRLEWLARQYVVFWDEKDKRGWLVNGTSAVLHLVRASLKYAKSGEFASNYTISEDDITEASEEFTPNSAIELLKNKANKRLKIYGGGDEDEDDDQGNDEPHLFKDRFDVIYQTVEQIIDHEIEANRQAGVNLKPRARAHLEGWDFKSVATNDDPFYPRVAKLEEIGRGWVDFVRGINAIVLLGKGFGELIQPRPGNSTCPLVSSLPTQRYYLAAGAGDLQKIADKYGDPESVPVKLAKAIYWYNPQPGGHIPCHCNARERPQKRSRALSKPRTGCNFTQVLLPSKNGLHFSFAKRWQGLAAVNTENNNITLRGAYFFGYTSLFPWVYRNHGEPEPIPLAEPEPETDAQATVVADENPQKLALSAGGSGFGDSSLSPGFRSSSTGTTGCLSNLREIDEASPGYETSLSSVPGASGDTYMFIEDEAPPAAKDLPVASPVLESPSTPDRKGKGREVLSIPLVLVENRLEDKTEASGSTLAAMGNDVRAARDGSSSQGQRSRQSRREENPRREMRRRLRMMNLRAQS